MKIIRKLIKNNFKFSSTKNQSGFTLMEIIVSTTIFAIFTTSLLGLFNYALKINRRTEALRQASQGVRDFMEFLVKEIRNGQIDYFVSNGTTLNPNFSPCTAPGSLGANTYGQSENKISIINTDNVKECIFLGYGPGGNGSLNSYVGNDIFTKNITSSDPNYNPKPNLVINKYGVTGSQAINPSNMRIDNLMFNIRPRKDPYTLNGGLAEVQPFVNILLKVTVQLPTGEQVPITYQTSVSSNKYDIPNE